jgi:hypothetical protein
MFVTSDIFDHEAIARFRDLDWRENLLGGVDVQGTHWRGYQSGARFLLEASERCGLVHEMRYAGYNRLDEVRTRNILPKSFGRLADGALSGAKEATSVLLQGERSAMGTYNGEISFGGQAGAIRQRRGLTGPVPVAGPPWRFSANFGFPLDEDPVKLASDLFLLSVDILGAEYGYHFVRDALCGPWFYTYGISAPLDYKPLSYDDAMEVEDWAELVAKGGIWSSSGPMLRDLFQVNLLSQRHRAALVDGVGLLDWIAARPGRGQLDDIGQGRWLWTLTDAEMVAVRPLLNAAGLLVSCRPRVYRDLPNHGQELVTAPPAGSPN